MAFWMSMEDGAVNKLIKGRNPDDTPAARVEKLDRWLRIADALHMPDRNRELIGLARKAPHTGLAQGLTPIDGPLTRSDMDSPNAPAYSLLDRTHEHSDMAANEGDGWAVRRASHVMDRSIEDFDRLLSGQVPAVSDKGRRIGAGTVADFSARAHGLRLADDLLAGKDLIEPALRELKACIRLCREADYTEEVGRSLLTVIGEISQIVGWIVSDAGRCRLAEDIYRIGMHAAHEAGDAVLEANLIGSLAYQVSNVGDPSEGVVLARAALKASGGNAPPRARALCWDRIAWAHAQTGEAQEAMSALGEAGEALGQHGDEEEPAYLYWVDAGELQVMEARVHTEMRRPLRAVPILTDVLSRYDATHTRELALYLSWLAVAFSDANEPEEAARTARRMLNLSGEVASERTADRSRVVLTRLKPFEDVPEVRELLGSFDYVIDRPLQADHIG